MNAVDPELHAEERSTHPLFTARRSNECAWPLWSGSEPLTEKRCCGSAVRLGSKIPYCAAHLKAQRPTFSQRSE